MGVRSDLEAAKKALNDALSKVDAALKTYEEKKKKGEGDLKRAEAAINKIAKAASGGGGGEMAAIKADAAAAASAVSAAAAASASA